MRLATSLGKTGLAVLVTASLMTACGRSTPPLVGADEPVVLRTYDQIPPGSQDELRSMLQAALGTGENRRGQVSNGPGDSLLVVAPASIQDALPGILEAARAASPDPGPITLTYWFLLGRPLPPSRASERVAIAGGRDLSAIEPALTQIVNVQGPTEFALLEQIGITSMNQQDAGTGGRFVQYLNQRVTRRGGQIVADIESALRAGNSFQTQVVLEPGQFLVLGNAGYSGRGFEVLPNTTPADLLTLYYVVTGEVTGV